MNPITLPVKRPFSWKAFLVLLALMLPAAFAILPFALSIQSATQEPASLQVPMWVAVTIDALANFLIAALLGALGLFLATRIGLGLPFIEGWVKKEPVRHRMRGMLGVSTLTGIIFALVVIGLSIWIFGPAMQAMLEEMNIQIPAEVTPPPWQGFLASFSAGIQEEVLFRLFGLSVLAWLGSLLSRDREGRPSLAVLWIANLVFAVMFGLAHLPLANTIGLPMNALVITRTIILNSLGGLAFGWLYWTFGLESAMLAHFSADIVLHVLLPWFSLQEGQTNQILVGVVILAGLALVFWWALRGIAKDMRQFKRPASQEYSAAGG